MFSGRTRGAFFSQSVTPVVLIYYRTRVYICGAHARDYRRHDPRRALVLSAPFCEERCGLCESTRTCGTAARGSRTASTQNSNREKKDTSYQFPSRADVSQIYSSSLKHLLFMAFYVLTEALPWEILYVGQYPAGKVLIYER